MILLGRDLAIWVENASGEWEQIGYERSCAISIESEIKAVTGRTLGTWSHCRPIRLSWRIRSENLYSVGTFDRLFDRLVHMRPVMISFSPYRNNIYGMSYDDSKRYYGEAYIQTIDGSADMGDAGKISAVFVGNGEIKKVVRESTGVFDFTFDKKFE